MILRLILVTFLSLTVLGVSASAMDRAEYDAYMQARQLQVQGNYSGAIQAWKQLLNQDPKNTDVLVSLAFCYRSVGDYKGAAEAYAKVYALQPAREDVYEPLAECYFELKDFPSTIQFCREYIAKFPTNKNIARAWFDLGRAQARLGQFDECLNSISTALNNSAAEEWMWDNALAELNKDAAEPQLVKLFSEYVRKYPTGRDRSYYESRIAQLKRDQEERNFEAEAITDFARFRGSEIDQWITVPLPFQGKITTLFVAETEKGLSTIPAWIWRPLRQKGLQIWLVPHTPDAFGPNDPDPASQPRGYALGSTYDNVPALCLVGRLVIAQEYRQPDGKWVPNKDPDGAVAHELGHAYDRYLGNQMVDLSQGGQYKLFSHSQAFTDAFDADAPNVRPEDKQMVAYFLQSGKAGQEELFAELFPLFFEREGRMQIGIALKRSFPTVLAAIERARAKDPHYVEYQQGPRPR